MLRDDVSFRADEISTEPLDGPMVWPWETEPYKLWSLLDMLRFYAHTFCKISGLLGQMWIQINQIGNLTEQDAKTLAKTIGGLQRECSELGLKGIVSQIDNFKNQTDSGLSAALLSTLLQSIQLALISELEGRVFLYVPFDRQSYYEASPAVDLSRFGCAHDMEEAGKCYALDRYAACVFHLMRVTEAGVLELGTLIEPGDHKPQFGFVLKKIDRLLQRVEFKDWPEHAKPHQALFRQVLPRLYAVKDAWRDKVMHIETKIIPTESQYTPGVALDIWNATVSLMRLLAERLPPAVK